MCTGSHGSLGECPGDCAGQSLQGPAEIHCWVRGCMALAPVGIPTCHRGAASPETLDTHPAKTPERQHLRTSPDPF